MVKPKNGGVQNDPFIRLRSLVFRYVMALGACGGLVASRAMILDLFPVNKIATILSSFMLIIALSPLLAPAIDGYLAASPGWYAVSLTPTAAVVALLVVALVCLPESKGPDATVSLRPAGIARRYLAVAFVALSLSGRLSLPLALVLLPAYLFCVGMINPNLGDAGARTFRESRGKRVRPRRLAPDGFRRGRNRGDERVRAGRMSSTFIGIS